MSKTKFFQSLTASARASAISGLEFLMESKTEVPERMKHFRDYLMNPQPRGRPKGKLQYDDTPNLIEMGRLLETGEAGTVNRAAKIVVARNPDLAPQTVEDDSVVRRLSNAFKEDPALYRLLGREADPISLKKAAR